MEARTIKLESVTEAIFCLRSYSRPTGFSHECTLQYRGYHYTDKCHYINRTWEFYRYQTVMAKAVTGLYESIVCSIKRNFKADNNLNAVRKKKDREELATLISSDIRLIELRELYHKVMGDI